jgi:hypothetical protein
MASAFERCAQPAMIAATNTIAGIQMARGMAQARLAKKDV